MFKAGTVESSQGTVTKGNAAGDTAIEIALGSIPPGATVRVNFDVQTKRPAVPPFAKNQGLVRAPGVPNVLTDDPDTPAPNDPTITILEPALAVQLLSFRAERAGASVRVGWATSAELNTWGFLLFRGSSPQRAEAAQATPSVMLARGRGTGGGEYEWIDTHPPAGTIYYWLQEIELSGATHEYGPIMTAGR